MTDTVASTAHEVHSLLLEARPETNDANLAEAAHLAESSGNPRDHFQLETFVAIRNLRTAINGGASAAEAESLLLHAIEVADHWASATKRQKG